VEGEVSTNGTGHAAVVDFLVLLNDPTRCADLPLETVPVVLMQIASGLTRLTALQDALAARMAQAPGAARNRGHQGADRLLSVREAAERLGMSPDWVYRHAKQLPFTRRVGRRALRIDPDGLVRWLAHHTPRRGGSEIP
jgi:excisionase family DNA binding protein